MSDRTERQQAGPDRTAAGEGRENTPKAGTA
jgi:hypothetical protein